jgi:hypothetical protein
MNNPVREELQTVLGSRTMLKVLGAIAKDPQSWQTAYSVCKETGLNNMRVRENLESLVELGWAEKHGEVLRKYRMNAANPRAKKFQEYLMNTGYFEFA